MVATKHAVGAIQLKSKTHCTICQCSLHRKIRVLIFSQEPAEIEAAKKKAKDKSNAAYTCRVCLSILKDVNGQ